MISPSGWIEREKAKVIKIAQLMAQLMAQLILPCVANSQSRSDHTAGTILGFYVVVIFWRVNDLMVKKD